MAVNISYKCPNCGAELFWSADKNCWACEYCDGQFTLKDLEEAGGDAKKAEELNKDNVEKHEEVDKDEYSMSNDGTVGNDLVKYTCSHCGAEIITDRSTAATVCVYCGNAVIMGEQIIDNFSPDYVIPFKVPKNQVMDAFKKFSKKPLTPKDFSCDKVVDKMQGVYIPFWLYSGNCEGSITAEGINTRTWTSGNYRYTEKKYYSVYRNGTLDFKAVPVDASSKTDDDAMDSIEPFDYSEMTAFNPGYLSGYLAERYDEDKDKCLPRAKERIENTTRDELRNTCNYNSVNVQSYEKHTEIKDVKYAMLPTWLKLPPDKYDPKTLEKAFAQIIGMKNVKSQISELAKYLQIRSKLIAAGAKLPDFNLHMMFLGNPGVGKTMIARTVSKLLFDLGYIRENKVVEVTSKDLIGAYANQTGIKTNKVIMNALGGVLFIDEAYSLAISCGQAGAEAIAIIIKAMMDHKDDLVVMFAGYTLEMKQFKDSNSGIASRISYVFNFNDYSEEELYDIFELKIHNIGMTINEEAIEKVKHLCKQFAGRKNVGNGRFVDNLIQKALTKHATLDLKESELLELTAGSIPSVQEIMTTVD